MIKSCKITSGFLLSHSHVRDRTFEFTKGLNFIFGTNGICKSTVMKTIAAHCGIDKGGWTSISEPSKLAAGSPNHFPAVYRQYAPGQCSCILERDGSPVFYNDSDSVSKNDVSWFVSASANNSDDGLTTEAERLDIMASKPSSGQFRIHKINKIMKVINQPPNLSIIPEYIGDKQRAQWEVDYIKSLGITGPITLLLDEPEKALALPKQLELFNGLQQLSSMFQIIVVTHSPFILFNKDANIIDMEPGYADICKKLIKQQISLDKKNKK
jgi:hypothetical protein